MKKDLIFLEDYYLNEKGFFVFTKEYHLKRGYCCSPKKKIKCLHCPFPKLEETK